MLSLTILTFYATFSEARTHADCLWQGKSSLGILGTESCLLHPSACAHMSGIIYWVGLIFQQSHFTCLVSCPDKCAIHSVNVIKQAARYSRDSSFPKRGNTFAVGTTSHNMLPRSMRISPVRWWPPLDVHGGVMGRWSSYCTMSSTSVLAIILLMFPFKMLSFNCQRKGKLGVGVWVK